MYWTLTHKGDARCARLADKHYSRQQPGMWSWTRPGYNYILYCNDDSGNGGEAVYCWWRPIDTIERFDKLHAIECTIFRNETHLLSSELIIQACAAVQTWEHYDPSYQLITGINTLLTTRGRSKHSPPGACYIHAGFQQFNKQTKLADTWLILPTDQLPLAEQPNLPTTKYKEARPPQPTNAIGLTNSQMTKLRKSLRTRA